MNRVPASSRWRHRGQQPSQQEKRPLSREDLEWPGRRPRRFPSEAPA